jgi:hypothetical protein
VCEGKEVKKKNWWGIKCAERERERGTKKKISTTQEKNTLLKRVHPLRAFTEHTHAHSLSLYLFRSHGFLSVKVFVFLPFF